VIGSRAEIWRGFLFRQILCEKPVQTMTRQDELLSACKHCYLLSNLTRTMTTAWDAKDLKESSCSSPMFIINMIRMPQNDHRFLEIDPFDLLTEELFIRDMHSLRSSLLIATSSAHCAFVILTLLSRSDCVSLMSI